MKCPVEVYQAPPCAYAGLPDIDHPFHDKTIVVTRFGRICLDAKKSISARSLPGRPWASELLENPFGPKVLPRS